jgi:hypothetical protein
VQPAAIDRFCGSSEVIFSTFQKRRLQRAEPYHLIGSQTYLKKQLIGDAVQAAVDLVSRLPKRGENKRQLQAKTKLPGTSL